jgi:hypothetical protein
MKDQHVFKKLSAQSEKKSYKNISLLCATVIILEFYQNYYVFKINSSKIDLSLLVSSANYHRIV